MIQQPLTINRLSKVLGGQIWDGRVVGPWPEGGGHHPQLQCWPHPSAEGGFMVLPHAARPFVVNKLKARTNV